VKKYIGTKLIQAEPAYRIDGKIYLKSGPVPRVMNRENGYKVVYQDGYESWSPKDVFEAAYLPVTGNENLRTAGPSISPRMVNDFIRNIEVIALSDVTTVVRAVLRNGFEIVESTSCISDDAYDEHQRALMCLERIKNKVEMLLGFLLQTAVHGIQ
jgi:hypothetical protein